MIIEKMWSSIVDWFKSLDTKTIIITFIEALIFIMLLSSMNHCSNQKIETLDHNLVAARDEIQTLVLENGNLLSEKSAYILKNKELESVLEITKQEKRDIEKKLNDKIAYIANIGSQVRVDTLELRDTIYQVSDNRFNIDWSYSDKWLKLKGGTLYNNGKSTTELYGISLYTPLKVGLTDNYTIFVESENPYLKITDIEGAIIDGSSLRPKPNYWTLSIQGGFGAQYGLVNKKFDVGPYVGAGISYNFRLGKNSGKR